MNIQLQRYNIRKHLQRLGIDHDLIDIEAITDPTLSYEENYKRVMEDAKSLVHDKDMIRLKEAGLDKPYSEKKQKNAVHRWMRWTWNHKETTTSLRDFL